MPSLPNIPVEVWRHIFVEVIRIPGLLLTDRTDPFSPIREADLLSMLLLVHEHVFDLYDRRRPLGTHTRQVMINLARILNNSYTTVSVGSHYISPPFCTPSDVIQALLSTSASSLHRLEWTCNECPSWDDLMLLLRALRSLCSLTLANIYGSYPEIIKKERLILPNLRTLILGDSPSFHMHRLATLEGFSPFSPTFLSTHGYKIRIIRTVAYTPLLPDIIAECSNLETFITIFPHQFLDRLTHSSLRRIGIFPISEDVVGVPAQIFSAYIMKPLEDLMCQIEQSDLPSLTHVRLRNVGTLGGVINYPGFIRKWQDHWNSRNVRFDDRDGHSFDADALDADERPAIDPQGQR
ncbi:hypothetical protein EDC04DRAFT_2872017 [Pisolithus marmoratus]|nr:hypothetical protein EDC04DRAFT_2872017 [Pisolithus marmoratus]